MKIYDTLSGEKKKIEKDKKLNLFVCGPTVYDFSHIGHARTYLAFDIIVKYLRSRGYKIEYVQNITDIDDKIIKRAKESGKNPLEVSDEFEKEYLQDMETLGIDSVDEYVKASDVIPEIIKQIKDLIDNGYAYKTSTGIYFKVRSFNDYGKLSNQDIDSLESGVRIEVDEEKEDPLDFSLWKFPEEKVDIDEKGEEPVIVNGEPLWNSPWGWGRPGWHIEDTAISESRFGPQYDMHGGAEGLKFPHHESEIAQQEAASGKKPFVNIWVHTGFLMVGGEKMGKSLDNFITIRDFLKEWSPRVLRWMVLTHHYRSKMDYTKETAKQAEDSLENMEEFLAKMDFIKNEGEKGGAENLEERIEKLDEKIELAMDNDLNTPKAVSEIFKFIRETQDDIWSLKKKDAEKIRAFIVDTFNGFGMKFEKMDVPEKVMKLAQKREKLRGNEQFMQADELRDEVRVLGYEIEDTPLGPFIKKSQDNG